MTTSLLFLFERDLNKLAEEIALYEKEENLWKLEGDIKNTAGNLALHIVGNLNHFVGHVLGNSNYIRQREKEFSDRGIARETIVQMIWETLTMVKSTLSAFPADKLQEDFPIQVFKEVYSIEQMLLQLYGHLTYHLGQINYHRRLLDR
jgi:hypothetical protein